VLWALSSAVTTGTFTLGGTLGAVVVTGIMGIILARMNATAAERKSAVERSGNLAGTLRVERRECFARFLVAGDNAFRLAAEVVDASTPAERRRLLDKDVDVLGPLNVAAAELTLVAPEGTVEAADCWTEHLVTTIFADAPQSDWLAVSQGLREALLAKMRESTITANAEVA